MRKLFATDYRRDVETGRVYAVALDRHGRCLGASGPLTFRELATTRPDAWRVGPARWCETVVWSNLTTDEIREGARALIIADVRAAIDKADELQRGRILRAMQELPLAGDL